MFFVSETKMLTFIYSTYFKGESDIGTDRKTTA